MNVKEILDRQPPAVLYHYTTQSGLLGILRTKEIWASHTQYLNDTREYRHAIDIAKQQLASMRQERRGHDELGLLAEMEQGLSGIESINVCVCSFSANGDILSQWRAYGERTCGFSMGFSGLFLRAISDSLKFWLVPVLYQESEQCQLVRTLLEERPYGKYGQGSSPGPRRRLPTTTGRKPGGIPKPIRSDP